MSGRSIGVLRLGKQMSGREKGFAEMTGDDLLGLAHRSEVDAGVPAEQHIDVRRYILQLGFGEWNRKEWL